jgi:hypothetical protein
LIHGVRGEYFTNMTLSGSPALTRLDPQIYFNWAGEVFPGTSDQCSVRWTGEVEPAFTEAYTFYVNTDDGARLWLNGNPIIDAWWDQGATEYAGQPIPLVAGQKYPLRLEWYDNALSATCELRWSSPSTPKQVIPSARLHPPEPGTSGGSPSMTLDPTNGPVGTTVTIAGSGFAANTSGNVSFGGKSYSVTTTPAGTFSTTMTVPSASPGNHPVEADIPSGGSIEASASFAVTASGQTPSIVVSPTSGYAGLLITITGSDFTASTSGMVYLARFSLGGKSVPVTTSPTGTFSTTMTVPGGLQEDHSYAVEADIPSGGSIEASASFTVTARTPSIVVSPTSGPVGTQITITGSGFAASTSGYLVLGNYSKSPEMWWVNTSPTGTFSVFGEVPLHWNEGVSYTIDADIPIEGPIEASASFTVTAPPPEIQINPTHGHAGDVLSVTGHHFAGSTSGTVTLGSASVPVTTDPEGMFDTHLTVPGGLSGGVHHVVADIPSGGSIEASASFTVK